MTRLFLLIVIISFTLSSCQEPEETIGDIPSGKTFSLAVPAVAKALATGIYVSENGNHIYLKVNNSVSNGYYYSSDAGATFTQKSSMPTNGYIISVDNSGTVLASSGLLLSSTGENLSQSLPGFNYILGDNGKIFAYSMYGELKVRNTTGGTYQDIPSPNLHNWAPKVVKVPGKGIAVIESISAGNPTAYVHVIDESTLEVTTHTLTIDQTEVNGCNNLNRFLGFNFQYNDKLIIKGCSGMGVFDLVDGSVKYIPYPDNNNAVYTDLRDYPTQMDDKGNIYLFYADYSSPSQPFAYVYDGQEFSKIESFATNPNLGNPFVVNHNTLYFNSNHIEETVIASAMKLNIETGEHKQLRASVQPLQITNAVAEKDDEILLVIDQKLFKYNSSTGTMTRFNNLNNITHANILADGRYVAGGPDQIHISTNKGSSWETHENIFTNTGAPSFSVNDTRLVNGKVVIVGTNKTVYYNQSTGMSVDQFANIAVELNGTLTTSTNYDFPSDFQLSCIAPDGGVYGIVQYMDPFTYQTISTSYLVKDAIAPQQLQSGIPILVTEEGLQAKMYSPNPMELEIQTRTDDNAEWKNTGSKFIHNQQLYGGYKLRSANKILSLTYHSEVYVLK